MKMKKLISAIIALAMCVSLITAMPMSVSAATTLAEKMLEQAYWEVENTAENGYTTNGTYWNMNAPEIADGKMYLTAGDGVMLMLSNVPNIGDFNTSSTYTIEFDATATSTVTDARTLYVAPAGWWNNVEIMGNKIRTGDTWTTITSANQDWHYKVEISNTTITSTITDSNGATVSTGYRTNAEYAKFWNYCLRCENGAITVDNVKVSKDGTVLLNDTFDYEITAADLMLEQAYWEVENTAENGYTTNGTYWEMNAPEVADGKMYLTPYDSVMLMLSQVPNIGEFSTSSIYTIEFDATATETVTDANTLYVAPAGWWNNIELRGNKVRTGDTWTNVTSVNQDWHYKIEIANTTITSTITDSTGAVVSTGYRTNAEYAKFWNYCLRCQNGAITVDNVKVSKDGTVLLNETFDYLNNIPETATTVTNSESYIEFPTETVVTEGTWTGSFDFMTNVADGSSVAWRNTFMNGINSQGGTKVIGAWVYTEGTSGLHVKAGDWDGSYQGALTKGTWYTCKVTIDYEDTTSGSNARWYIYERDTETKLYEYWTNITSSIDRLLIQDEKNSGTCYVDNVTASVELPEGPAAYEDQEYTFDDGTLPENWAAGTGDGYSITDGQLVLGGSANWGVDVTFDPNLRESGKYIIGWDYTTQGTSFGDYGLFLKLLDSADMSQVKEVFSHMGDGQIHLGNQVFWNISLPTSRMELEVDVDTKEWQLYIDGNPVTNEGGSGVGTWTESIAIGFMNYQHGTCKIDNVTVTKVVEKVPSGEIASNDYASGTAGWSGDATITNEGGYLKIEGVTKGATLDFTDVTSGVIESSLDLNFANVADANGSDGTCFLNIGWTNGNIDTVPRGGWRFNLNDGTVDLMSHDNWTTYDLDLAINQWYTMKTIIDVDAGTQTVALYTQGGTEAIQTYEKTWVAGTAVANMHMWVRLADGSYILADNFVLKYKQDVPSIKTVTYSSSDEDVVLATSVVAAVEPDVKALTVELTTAPADYKIADYIKLFDSSDAELAYEYEISGNAIIITPDAVFAEDATYKLTISKDLYAANGCQLGYDANYTVKTNVGSLKGKLISVTNASGTELTTADELLSASSFKINYKITNTSGDACEILVLRVYYDVNGYAVKSVPVYLNFTADQTSVVDAVTATSDSATGAESVRVFLWNDFDKYVPLCENILLP